MNPYSAQQPAHMPYMPLPVMPELVSVYGVEEALMLSVLIEIVGAWQGQVSINEQRLYNRLKHLTRQQQGVLLASLVAQDVVEVIPAPHQQLQINLKLTMPNLQDVNRTKPSQALAPHHYHVNTSGDNQRHAEPNRQYVKTVASSGGRGRDDELSRIFAAKEAEIAQQYAMSVDWQPSENILKLLQQNMGVEPVFAMSLRDEFSVYYMDKGRKESPGGWDQKFLKWVKREQVQQQNKSNQSNNSYRQHEEARYTAKEKRRQLTKTVLDIGNTDW